MNQFLSPSFSESLQINIHTYPQTQNHIPFSLGTLIQDNKAYSIISKQVEGEEKEEEGAEAGRTWIEIVQIGNKAQI